MTTPQTSSTNDVSYQKITKKVASSKDNKKLSVLSPTFERHPSASKLLNATEAKDPLILVNDSNDKNKSPSSAPSLYLFTIVLNETDNPLYDKNDIFYIKNENISSSPKKSKNNLSVKPNFLSLTPQQIELDEKITQSIQKGENFKEIKKMFKGCLLDKN